MTVKTPCKKICKMDALSGKFCSGCFRTEEEIRDWRTFPNGRKRFIKMICKVRESNINKHTLFEVEAAKNPVKKITRTRKPK